MPHIIHGCWRRIGWRQRARPWWWATCSVVVYMRGRSWSSTLRPLSLPMSNSAPVRSLLTPVKIRRTFCAYHPRIIVSTSRVYAMGHAYRGMTDTSVIAPRVIVGTIAKWTKDPRVPPIHAHMVVARRTSLGIIVVSATSTIMVFTASWQTQWTLNANHLHARTMAVAR